MSYYSSFKNNLKDMYFDADVLTEDMLEEFHKDTHFFNFLHITNAKIHFSNCSENGSHVTMISFPKHGANAAKSFSFKTDIEHGAKILNPYAHAPLYGEIFRTGERSGDFEKYIINEDGTVTSKRGKSAFV